MSRPTMKPNKSGECCKVCGEPMDDHLILVHGDLYARIPCPKAEDIAIAQGEALREIRGITKKRKYPQIQDAQILDIIDKVMPPEKER